MNWNKMRIFRKSSQRNNYNITLQYYIFEKINPYHIPHFQKPHTRSAFLFMLWNPNFFMAPNTSNLKFSPFLPILYANWNSGTCSLAHGIAHSLHMTDTFFPQIMQQYTYTNTSFKFYEKEKLRNVFEFEGSKCTKRFEMYLTKYISNSKFEKREVTVTASHSFTVSSCQV